VLIKFRTTLVISFVTIMRGEVFISYSKKQPEPTQILAGYLESLGYEVWWDTDLIAGQDFEREIGRRLDEARAVIVIWTRESVTSDWVRSEAEHGRRLRKLIPLRVKDLEPSGIPKPFGTLQTDTIEYARGELTPESKEKVLAAVVRLAGTGTRRQQDNVEEASTVVDVPSSRFNRLHVLIAAVFALAAYPAVIAVGSLFDAKGWSLLGNWRSDEEGASGVLVGSLLVLMGAMVLAGRRGRGLLGTELALYWLGCCLAGVEAFAGLTQPNDWAPAWTTMLDHEARRLLSRVLFIEGFSSFPDRHALSGLFAGSLMVFPATIMIAASRGKRVGFGELSLYVLTCSLPIFLAILYLFWALDAPGVGLIIGVLAAIAASASLLCVRYVWHRWVNRDRGNKADWERIKRSRNLASGFCVLFLGGLVFLGGRAALLPDPRVWYGDTPFAKRLEALSPLRAGAVVALATGTEPKISKQTITGLDGGEMVFVPAGEFWMGSSENELSGVLDDCRRNGLGGPYSGTCDEFAPSITGSNELSRHRVYLSAYYIDKFEITNELFKHFMDDVTAQGYVIKPPSSDAELSTPRQPVVDVSWRQADAYCRWAGKHLPTEAEWEKAARGADGRKYPWGNDWDSSKANAEFRNRVSRTGWPLTSAVGSYPGDVSPYGAYDMAGNASEWVADWYGREYYKQSPSQNPKGPDSGSARVIRGGHFQAIRFDLRAAHRNPGNNLIGTVGFRCAKSAD
jgi:formylglycine-generating enzyme required for sulfatase activity